MLDTNRYTDLARGDAEVGRVVDHAEQVVIPFIVLAELRTGFERGARREQNEKLLRRFLAEPNVLPVFPDMTTTRVYAGVVATLYQQATPIPTNDIWIAALALQHDVALYTRDEHFRHVRGLSRL